MLMLMVVQQTLLLLTVSLWIQAILVTLSSRQSGKGQKPLHPPPLALVVQLLAMVMVPVLVMMGRVLLPRLLLWLPLLLFLDRQGQGQVPC
jgi:hypothetical protein